MLNVPFPRFGAAAVPLQFLLLDQVLAHRFSSFKCFLGFAFQRLLDLQFLNPCCIALLQVLGCCQWGGAILWYVGASMLESFFISSQLLIIELLLPTCQAVQLLAACWILKCSHPVQGPRSTVHSPLSGPGSVVQGPLSRWAAELPEAVVQDVQEFVEEHLAPAPGLVVAVKLNLLTLDLLAKLVALLTLAFFVQLILPVPSMPTASCGAGSESPQV